MLIYKVTNKINGKIYVGQTTKELERRKGLHLSRTREGSNFPFCNAIRKYGKENFDWIVLEKCNTIEELNIREEYWIKKLNTISPHGYNLESGGKNGLSSEESKVKMRENHADFRGEKHPMYGRKHTKETIERMSKIKKGKKHTEESKDKMRKSKQGENHPYAKLTETDIIDIRNWYKEGMLQREISEIKNTAIRNVGQIINRKAWTHIA